MGENFIKEVSVRMFKCIRCGHKWVPRGKFKLSDDFSKERPRICPHCNSPYWDVEKMRRM